MIFKCLNKRIVFFRVSCKYSWTHFLAVVQRVKNQLKTDAKIWSEKKEKCSSLISESLVTLLKSMITHLDNAIISPKGNIRSHITKEYSTGTHEYIKLDWKKDIELPVMIIRGRVWFENIRSTKDNPRFV